ncbi:MAG: hypothetical protein ACFFD4_40420, partial [Candidatus Odinarchaeota archaeon]
KSVVQELENYATMLKDFFKSANLIYLQGEILLIESNIFLVELRLDLAMRSLLESKGIFNELQIPHYNDYISEMLADIQHKKELLKKGILQLEKIEFKELKRYFSSFG